MSLAANFLRHTACDACDSTDANALYDDGHTHCFSCGARTSGILGSTPTPEPEVSGLIECDPLGFNAREISSDTAEKYTYGWGDDRGEKVHVASYHTREGLVVAQKIRRQDKSFSWVGEPKKAGLFGQHLCRDGGKRIVITEGELDALSVSQVQGNTWPCVSVPNGAQGAAKDVAKALDWLSGYDQVVIMFDMDEPGRKASVEVAALFKPGTVSIASLPKKDPNEMLKAGLWKELRSAVWEAPTYKPSGIVYGEEVIDAMAALSCKSGVDYPLTGLTEMTRGVRPGEIVTVCAGTGIGKSTFCTEIAGHILDLTPSEERIGYIALEENYGLSGIKFCTLQAGRPVHLDEQPASREELADLYAPYKERLVLYNHFGSTESDSLLNRIRYMIVGLNAKWLVLDHLSIVVSGMDQNNDERKTIDHLMTNLRSMMEETQASLVLVSHLKRLQGGQRGFEQGATPMLSHLRGSAAIEQLSDIVIGLGRDQQAETDSNLCEVRVLKNRWTGQLGRAGYLHYNRDTGRLLEHSGVAASGFEVIEPTEDSSWN